MFAVKVEDLNPIEATIKIDGNEYTLRKFDLLAQSWANREFATKNQPNGLFILADKIKDFNNNFDTLLECTWHLLKEKKVFGSYDGFCKAVIEEGERRKSQTEIMGDLLKAFTYTLGISTVKNEDIREDEELKKP